MKTVIMKNLNFKSAFIAAAMFLLLLTGSSMKLYAQYTIYLNPSNGITFMPGDLTAAISEMTCRELPQEWDCKKDEDGDCECEGVDDVNTFYSLPMKAVINAGSIGYLEEEDTGVAGILNTMCISSVSSQMLTTIGEGAFISTPFMFGCGGTQKELKSVDFPNVTRIDGTAFSGCRALSSVNIPLARSIGFNAFYDCRALPYMEGEFVSAIGQYAFQGCNSLKTASFGGVKLIEDGAFWHCAALETIILHDVEDIKKYAFDGCTALKNVTVSGNNLDLGKVKTIENAAFRNCSSLREASCSATEIGNSAFSGCTSLNTVTCDAATKIGDYTFSGCTSLEKLSSKNLQNCFFKNTVDGCYELKEIYLDHVEIIPNYYEEEGIFENRTKLNSFVLSSCLEIGARAFRGCTALPDVVLPEAFRIGDKAFQGCESLFVAHLPKVIVVGDEAFQGCKSLENLYCPFLTHIGDNAFAGCTSLQETILPKISSSSIGSNAFGGCTALTKVTLGTGLTEPTNVNVADNAFDVTSNIELILGENVLPKPEGNSWKGNTWKSVTVVPTEAGIEEVTLADAMSVYPNPVTDLLHVKCKDCVSTEYVIYNLMGHTVMQDKLQGGISNIDVKFLSKGTYFLHIAEMPVVKFIKN